MKIKNLKFYFIFLTPIIFSSCENNYLSNRLINNHEKEIKIESIYNNEIDIYIEENSNFKRGDLINEDKEFPFHLIDTTITKGFKFELDYYTEENSKDSIWSKVVFEILFGKIETENINHWFPISYKEIGYSRNEKIFIQTRPIFFFTFEEKDTLNIFIPNVFELGGIDSNSKTIKNGNQTSFSFSGPITSEIINPYWNSLNGNLILSEIKIEDKEIKEPTGKTIELTKSIENTLEDRILKEIFHTKRKLSKRLKINSK